ncbi:MAG: hypothetical protein ROZ00_09245 [Denitratisoma sp.]|nr:hypothetical protein [Denitratisoma sp.]
MDDPERIDCDIDLKSLIADIRPTRLDGVLRGLLGEDFRLCDNNGETLLGDRRASRGVDGVPLQYRLDRVGTLSAPSAAPENLRAAADFLELVFEAGERLGMAAGLHLQAAQEDYRALLERHAALAGAEAHYRALAGELEARVQVQVATIERTWSQLYQAERQAAGIAQELDAPLDLILCNLATARSYLRHFVRLAGLIGQSDAAALKAYWQEHGLEHALRDFAELVEASLDNAERMAHVVTGLKDDSQADAATETDADLNECLHQPPGAGSVAWPAPSRRD